MLKKFFTLLLLCLIAIPVAFSLSQDNQEPVQIEITGIDATNLPTVVITVSVTNALGQPILGLTQDNFTTTIEGADGVVPDSSIVSVENVSSDAIPFSVVLMIDVSTSMDGTPLDEAKEAARVFVNSISAQDSVALMTFGSTTTLVQDFTTDKDVLISAIDSLRAGGVTALYQGSADAVAQALNAPTERRVVIILSDGAEFGDASSAAREDALQQAIINGVPVYTIGLGFGTDRSYLDSLASGTNASFYESPTEDELVEIYGGLASLLRSQYIITLTLPIEPDGQTYTTTVEVNTDEGSASTTGVLRAPIPVPIIQVTSAQSPVSEPTTFEFTVFADDPLTNVTITQGDETLVSEDNPEGDNSEYTFTVEVDPARLAPTAYTMEIQATDEDGDVGTASYTYEVSVLPSVVSISGLPGAGEELNAPAEVSVVVEYSQTPVTEIEVNINDEVVETTGDTASQTFTLDPYTLSPGENTISVYTTNSDGSVTMTTATFAVAALPPVITLTGLSDGDEVTELVTVGMTGASQSPIASVSWFLDGSERSQQFSEPFRIDIDPLTLSAGEHTLNVTATDVNGASSTVSVTFTVPESVALTATALAPTSTPTFTSTPQPTETPTPSQTPNAQETQSARDTAAAQFAADAQATSDAIGTATVSAQNTANADANAQATNSQATSDAANAQAIADAQGTLGAQQAVEMQTSQADTQATVNAAIAQSTVNAEQAQMTANAQATLDATNAQATNQAGLTATAVAQLSVEQQTQAAATQNAANEQATANVQSTQDTLNARETSTAQVIANAQATADAEATNNAEGTQGALDSDATANAEATQLRADQLTGTAIIQSARETAQAAATATGAAVADALSDQLTQTEIAAGTLTAEFTPSRIPPPSLTPTGALTEVEAQGAPDNNAIVSPLLVGCGLGIILLLIIFFILNRRRTRSKTT